MLLTAQYKVSISYSIQMPRSERNPPIFGPRRYGMFAAERQSNASRCVDIRRKIMTTKNNVSFTEPSLVEPADLDMVRGGIDIGKCFDDVWP